MYRIVSFDGGGIRSIFSARLVQRLQEETGFLDKAHMFAGNSAGSIVAASLACRIVPGDIVNFFQQECQGIFSTNFVEQIVDGFGLNGARYPSEGRLSVFRKHFGTRRLSDCEKKIVITAFDLKHRSGRWTPVSFHNFENSRYKNLSFVDAVMASTAAQTYFPAYPLGDSTFADGGVWANNPSMSALAEAISEYRGRQRLTDVVIFNIGTILNKMSLLTSELDLGVYDWLKHGLLDLMLDSGAMDAVDYYCRSLLGPRYFRLNILSDEMIKFDDIDKIDRLIELANEVDLNPVISWLIGFWR